MREKPKPDKKPSVKSKLDEKLFEDLDGKDPKAAPADPTKNPLEEAIKGMRSAQDRITEKDTGEETREVQEQVVANLQKLIDMMKDRQSKPPSASSGQPNSPQNQDPQQQTQGGNPRPQQQAGDKNQTQNAGKEEQDRSAAAADQTGKRRRQEFDGRHPKGPERRECRSRAPAGNVERSLGPFAAFGSKEVIEPKQRQISAEVRRSGPPLF